MLADVQSAYGVGLEPYIAADFAEDRGASSISCDALRGDFYLFDESQFDCVDGNEKEIGAGDGAGSGDGDGYGYGYGSGDGE